MRGSFHQPHPPIRSDGRDANTAVREKIDGRNWLHVDPNNDLLNIRRRVKMPKIKNVENKNIENKLLQT